MPNLRSRLLGSQLPRSGSSPPLDLTESIPASKRTFRRDFGRLPKFLKRGDAVIPTRVIAPTNEFLLKTPRLTQKDLTAVLEKEERKQKVILPAVLWWWDATEEDRIMGRLKGDRPSFSDWLRGRGFHYDADEQRIRQIIRKD